MFEADVNFLAILVAAVATQAIGALWYSPILFAKPWMRLSKVKESDVKEGASAGYVISFIAALIAGLILSHIIAYVGADDALEGLATGAMVWLGFVTTVQATDRVFSSTPSAPLYLINTGYQLVSFLIMGAILGIWQ